MSLATRGSGQEPSLPTPLSLEDALAIFRSRGLDLLMADAAVASARADLKAAKAVANPALSAGWVKSFSYDPSLCADQTCSATGHNFGLSDQGTLVDLASGKHGLRVDIAQAALAAARSSRADAERTLTATFKQQYLAVALAAAAVELAAQNNLAAAETLRLVDIRYRVGAVSEADTARAEAAALETEQGVDQARESLREAKTSLGFLLGVRTAPAEFEVSDTFPRAEMPRVLAGASAESMLELALGHRPDLQAAAAQQARATASLSLARRQRVPDGQLSLSYGAQGSGQSAIQPPTAGVALSFTLPVFHQFQGEIAHAEADLRTQELQRDKTRAQVLADVQAAWAAFEGAQRRAQRMDSVLLDRARRAHELVRIQYEKGAASLLELLDAQRTLIATEVERLQDLNDYWTAVFQLEQAVGMELRR